MRIDSSHHCSLDPRHMTSTTASEHSRRRVGTEFPARTSRRDTRVSGTKCEGITHGGSGRQGKFKNNAPFKNVDNRFHGHTNCRIPSECVTDR